MEQLGSDWTGFHEIWYLSILRQNCQTNLRWTAILTIITGNLHQHVGTFISHSVLIIRNVSDNVVEKIKTHILCSVTFDQKSWRL